ncbi:DUF5686 and carboxypeptidase-like regulatory domain-containing protein [Dysgonomonas sp. HGC4]|uniref:DUF5686 and carboxypeptidase-like regulatory domain-containing protein n=1 Tax=Dysgonomonas sp. HGC4 TaxID=1658009 RepID=UPI00067FBF99|nr:DUF5686 and carboxypeptidase-like regulatory domain-containing protein [Dysgonomonas sp. HGC4]MBD8347880.1 carboxypeptidase-like regulatory domain-containing protein [Dysgonomonas sp. HGC4]
MRLSGIFKLKVFLWVGISLVWLFCNVSVYGQSTRVEGIVLDSATNEAVESASVRFEENEKGELSGPNGKFSISDSRGSHIVVVSLMGYETQRITVPASQCSDIEIRLKAKGVQLQEIEVRPGKEKYSKKDNPAVALIQKVISHKNAYQLTGRDYYMYEEYDRLLLALNNYKADQGILRGLEFISKYADTSKIDCKPILPVSVRETLSQVYYRKNPRSTRRQVVAYQRKGLDEQINSESVEAIILELFKDVTITDNNINLLFHDFVSPLSSISSVNFYKWYILDTVEIENKKYVDLGFVPFNTRDVGFTGHIYVQPAWPYAIKKVSFRVPKRIQVNYVDNLLITQEFEEKSGGLWVPRQFTTAIELSMYGAAQLYVEKENVFGKYLIDQPADSFPAGSSSVIYLADYQKHYKKYWDSHRPEEVHADYQLGEMMNELRSHAFLDFMLRAAEILTSQYVPTSENPDRNKLDLGTTLTFYSYNPLEGNRFRLTGTTTKHLHPHFFMYGYLAYGTKDRRWKYYGEATWSFTSRKYHKDEYPRHNLSVAYKYDVNPLGQRFLQAERDNIFLSYRTGRYNNMTYDRMTEIAYIHEYYGGFSYNLYARTHNEDGAGRLTFQHLNEAGFAVDMGHLRTTEVGIDLRYAHGERFFQEKRKRHTLPSKGYTIGYSHIVGFKGLLAGRFGYHKSSLWIDKELWMAPYGRLSFSLKGEKIWGSVPFPLLLSANANSSMTIQQGSFYLLNPMEFLNDSQLTWHIDYHMGGWLFNRLPGLKQLKLRETAGFRGFWGHLSPSNNPAYQQELPIFPGTVYSMNSTPYLEYSVGIENIFRFFRVDYVRRLTYTENPDTDKSGFRISFEFNF